MADHSKSAVSPADANISEDSLTKEEKEALLTKKMDMIRQKNKALTERHKLIEADKKRAEEAGQAVKPSLDSQSLPAEGAPPRYRGRGRGHQYLRDDNGPGRDKARFSGDSRDTLNYEPVVEVPDLGHSSKGKGHGGHNRERFSNNRDTQNDNRESYNRDSNSNNRDPYDNDQRNRRKPPSEDQSTSFTNFEYEPIVDIKDLDKRFGLSPSSGEGWSKSHRHQMSDIDQENSSGLNHSYKRRDGSHGESKASGGTYKGRLKDSEGPPPDPSFNPLADRRRSDKKEEVSSDHKRHPRNYGGNVELSRVKQNMKNTRHKERETTPGNKPPSMVMTGKERRNHEEWKAERERYDQERIQRQMNDTGNWKRAWDAEKSFQENDEMPSPTHETKMEYARKPGLQHSDSSNRQQQNEYHQDIQKPSQHHQDRRTPLGRGRGRGRGRGFFNDPGDNRLVECQKELLLVKIDNTEGDKSVEVKYDDKEFPALSSQTPESSQTTTIPGRGPTGRTANNGSRQEGNNRQSHNYLSSSQPKSSEQEKSSKGHHKAAEVAQNISEGSFLDERINKNNASASSHSQNYDDIEDEWEDCSDESDGYEEDSFPADFETTATKTEEPATNLTLQCPPSSHSFDTLPISPDFMKTPPGHVKVLNWAAEGCPTSPSSQDSLTSPSFSGGPSPQSLPTA